MQPSAKNGGISVRVLKKTYRGGRVLALSDVTLEIRPGEIFGLIGPNGAGKTTLMGCLLGLLFPDSGSILIDGQTPDCFSVRRKTGYLPERLSFDRWMTGRQFVAYHHALAGRQRASRDEDVEALLARVRLDPASWDRPLKKFSRGMLQRLGLAQALAGRPHFLFLDEPSSGLDPVGVLLLRRLLHELHEEGTTVVINSHQLDQLERVCDRVAFIRAGRLEAVEELHQDGGRTRTVSVRWTRWDGESPATTTIPPLAREVGTPLLEMISSGARFSISDDEEAARLLQALLRLGARVTHFSSEEGRLERYFFDETRGAS